MNYSGILAQLKAASAFDLYRLRAAIDRTLDEPAWMLAVQARLRVGQMVEYFDPQSNASHAGQLLELRRKQAVVLDKTINQRWLISYAAINLDGADVEIREKPRQASVAMKWQSGDWGFCRPRSQGAQRSYHSAQ